MVRVPPGLGSTRETPRAVATAEREAGRQLGLGVAVLQVVLGVEAAA